MTRSEMRTACRNLLNEDVPGFWTDAQLNSYLNLAMQRVYSIISTTREDYFTTSATFSTIGGTKSYTMPTDCHFMRRMEIYDASDVGYIIKVDEMRFPRMEAGGDWLFLSAGQPQRFIVVGTHFDLYPIPDAAYTMRLYYDTRLNDLASDSDVSSVPVDFHDMIIFWACVLAKKQNEEDDAGFASLFNARKAELIELITRRGGEDARVVESYLEGII